MSVRVGARPWSAMWDEETLPELNTVTHFYLFMGFFSISERPLYFEDIFGVLPRDGRFFLVATGGCLSICLMHQLMCNRLPIFNFFQWQTPCSPPSALHPCHNENADLPKLKGFDLSLIPKCSIASLPNASLLLFESNILSSLFCRMLIVTKTPLVYSYFV